MNNEEVLNQSNLVEVSEEEKQEVSDLVAIFADSIDDISKFSARHNDLFDVELYELGEIVKRMRKQL
jgi:hypothetical protein